VCPVCPRMCKKLALLLAEQEYYIILGLRRYIHPTGSQKQQQDVRSARTLRLHQRLTLMSMDSSKETRGGMPPFSRTMFLMSRFSCARLVMASDARRQTP
jgi:hypothetical protein